ncbi:precorrin-6A reductase [Thermaerobacillus caldiproteolyticus]|uniref:precorrin-6A reductase n=1 Tax=Thermaerobacillus caldiproteolyticus TaxID=247480 RepID=UPI0018F1ED86|nr:precorrin-6A reductase [Anoxybacillus caldiproteolyticus]
MILVLAGTSDARALALRIKEVGYPVLTTVVTDHAANELRQAGLEVYVGRLTAADMEALIQQQDIKAVVDASHPFAEEASKNAISAAHSANVPYIRYERKSQPFRSEKLTVVKDYEEAALLAAEKKGVILLTTGSKTLHIFAEKLLHLPNVRLIARMLPRKDNIEKCEQLGIPQKNIVAIQGPFTKEFNQALFQQFGVTLLITKESGKEGAVDEKIAAAEELGIETILIRRPTLDYGTVYSEFSGVITTLYRLVPQPINERG